MANVLPGRLFTLLLLFTSPVWAQTARNSNDMAILKDINIEKYTGKKYIISADIKSVPTDSSSGARLFSLQVGKGDYDFIEGTSRLSQVSKDTIWHRHHLSGTIDKQSKRIWFYLTATGNGNFSFDNLSLKIQNDNNGWDSIEIKNSDFENTNNIKAVLKNFKNSASVTGNKNITATIQQSNDFYHQVLHISAENNKITYITIYGKNRSAGKYLTLKDSTRIYYETYGQGEPLLLLHGNGGSINSFKNQIPEFEKHYKVIAIDTRGQGNSLDTSTQNFSYDLFAKDAEELIEQLQLKKVNIVGWSDGGNTGLLLTIKHPELVNKLVLMGANLNPSDTSVTEKILQQTKKDINKLARMNDPANNVTIRLLEMLLKEPNIAVADLNNIKKPVLVLAGEKDLILERHTKLIAQNIPGAELNIVKGATHFLPEENPGLFNKLVLNFLLKN